MNINFQSLWQRRSFVKQYKEWNKMNSFGIAVDKVECMERRLTWKIPWSIKHVVINSIFQSFYAHDPGQDTNETIKLNEVETRLWLFWARSYAKQAIDNRVKTPRWISNLHFKHLLLCGELRRGEKNSFHARGKRSQWGGNDDDTFKAISSKLIEKSNSLATSENQPPPS
jgi:hypothetical protein